MTNREHAVPAVRPPTSIGDVVDIAIGGANHEIVASVGPIPLRVRGECRSDVDDVVRHLAPGPDPMWRPLTVVTITRDTLDLGLLPTELDPTIDDEIRVVREGSVTAVASGGERSLWVFDPERSLAVRWVDELGDLPLWERISPLRGALRWWATRHGASLVHTGAVADDRGAVLLVGDAGAGKSTTTMACLGRGLEVLGDDFCFVQPGDGRPDVSDGQATSVVHAAYRLAKLDDRSLDLLPHLRERIVGTGLRGKSLLELDALDRPERVIRALCHVVQRPDRPTETEPMSRVDALRAVAPSTLFQVRLFERETWEGLAGAVRTVPCFRLFVGDLDDVPGVLAALIDRLERNAS